MELYADLPNVPPARPPQQTSGARRGRPPSVRSEEQRAEATTPASKHGPGCLRSVRSGCWAARRRYLSRDDSERAGPRHAEVSSKLVLEQARSGVHFFVNLAMGLERDAFCTTYRLAPSLGTRRILKDAVNPRAIESANGPRLHFALGLLPIVRTPTLAYLRRRAVRRRRSWPSVRRGVTEIPDRSHGI